MSGSQEIKSVQNCHTAMVNRGLAGGIGCTGECLTACPFNMPEEIKAAYKAAGRNFPISNQFGVDFYPVFLTSDGKIVRTVMQNGGVVMTEYRGADEPETTELINMNNLEWAAGGGY